MARLAAGGALAAVPRVEDGPTEETSLVALLAERDALDAAVSTFF